MKATILILGYILFSKIEKKQIDTFFELRNYLFNK